MLAVDSNCCGIQQKAFLTQRLLQRYMYAISPSLILTLESSYQVSWTLKRFCTGPKGFRKQISKQVTRGYRLKVRVYLILSGFWALRIFFFFSIIDSLDVKFLFCYILFFFTIYYKTYFSIILLNSQLPDFLGGSCSCPNDGGCLRSDKGPWNDPDIMKVWFFWIKTYVLFVHLTLQFFFVFNLVEVAKFDAQQI